MVWEKRCYSRIEIRQKLGGGSLTSELVTIDKKVVAAFFDRSWDKNPFSPLITLIRKATANRNAADQLVQNGYAIPTFLKFAPNCWCYIGLYKVTRQSYDSDDVDRYAIKADRIGDVSSVLFMEEDTDFSLC